MLVVSNRDVSNNTFTPRLNTHSTCSNSQKFLMSYMNHECSATYSSSGTIRPVKQSQGKNHIPVTLSSPGGGGGGALNFFSGRGVRPGFSKCGACELTFASEKGGLWAENFQIWGLVSWKFPNLGACELKLGWKLRLLRLKFPNFLKRGSCELTLLLEMGPLRAAEEVWKGGLQGRTSPYSLSRSVPLRVSSSVRKVKNKKCVFWENQFLSL